VLTAGSEHVSVVAPEQSGTHSRAVTLPTFAGAAETFSEERLGRSALKVAAPRRSLPQNEP